MSLSQSGMQPANVKRPQDVPVTPQRVKKRDQKNAVTRWWAKVNSFDLLKLFELKRPPAVPRTVYVDLPLPAEAWAPTSRGKKQLKSGMPPDQIDRHVGKTIAKEWQYPSNQVLTSKYNVVTFIPKNLLEQFRRIANIFFLILVILQFFPRFSNVSPALAALPLLVVLAITALKDGYEDVKRHQSDRFINNIGCHVLAGPNVHNPNMTIVKTRGLSMRWLTELFGKRAAAKRVKRESEQAALEQDLPDDFDEDDRRSLAGGKKSFWGVTKRRLTTSKGSRARALSKVSKKSTNENGTDAAVQKNANGQPMVQRVQTFLVDDDEGNAREPDSSQKTAPTAPGAAPAGPNQPHWKKARWEDVRVGDFIRLRDGESIPADIIICATSEEENVCYVETKNLDGETNLKVRQAVPELTHIRSAKAASTARFLIHSEAPDVNMFKYSAAVEIHDGRLGPDGKPIRAPVNLTTVLLRGTVLRNTDWVVGIVVFTGIDTKIVLNSGGTPSKRGRVERLMNPMVFLNLGLLALACIMCAIGDYFEEKKYYDRNAYWEWGANRSGDNVRINGLIAFANAMITFQNIVPISLYISIEFVRTVQAFFIWADDDIQYDVTGRRTIARSWNLSDDLGQIEYVFSDKTGTLTQNSMEFRHCSIGGKVYKGDGIKPESTTIPEKAGQGQAARQDEPQYINKLAAGSSDSSSGSVGKDEKKGTKLPAEVTSTFHDTAIEQDLAAGGEQADRVTRFFTNLGLCHTVLASEDGEGQIEYKAQSPDEAALVQAAADSGFVFRGRDHDILYLQTPTSNTLDKYQLLNTLDFTSARKRMSVLLRKIESSDEKTAQNPIILFAKGADNVIFERLIQGDDAFKKKTDSHLEEFATEGLRTLTLAWKTVPQEEYEDWNRRYNEATLLIDNRDEEVEKVAGEIENGLHLLGATAIEDKLQDGVPEAIAALKRAGMKVWVATGDKLETAIAIGMSSNLLARDMNLIVIRGGAYGEPKSAYSQMKQALLRFFDAEAEIENFEYQPPDHHLSRPHGRQRPSLNLMRTGSRQSRGRHSTQLERINSGISGLSEFIDEDNGRKPGGYGLVIDGGSLQHALGEDFSKEMLLHLATRCQAVICCRVSPLQKALIVKLVKEGLGALCLAIGDGANDVSMIQAADVGVGVAGEEGLQAVNSSDYAIAQFRFLCKLLFVHGHWSYYRNSAMICNFFYKEIIGIGILFFFQFYCAFSTTIVYEYTFLLFWNVFWTLIPVIALGIFDRNLDQDVIMQVPEVYRYGIENRWFGLKRFTIYMVDGLYASAVCFFFLLYTYNTTTSRKDGFDIYLYEFSTLMAIAAVFIANFFNGFNTRAWNWWVFAGVLLGPVLILCWTAVYSAIKPGWIWTRVYGLNHFLWPSAYFWFGLFFCFFLAFLPRYLFRFWYETYRPTDVDILRVVHKLDKQHDFVHDPLIPAVKERRKYGADPVDPAEGLPLQSLAMQGRRMTDMSNPLQVISSRGFAFDEDPRPRRSTGSRPTSLLNPEGNRKGRARGNSIKIGPINLALPNMSSPGSTLKKNRKQRSSSTILERPEQASSSKAATPSSQQPALSTSNPVMHTLSVDPPPPTSEQRRSNNPFLDNSKP